MDKGHFYLHFIGCIFISGKKHKENKPQGYKDKSFFEHTISFINTTLMKYGIKTSQWSVGILDNPTALLIFWHWTIQTYYSKLLSAFSNSLTSLKHTSKGKPDEKISLSMSWKCFWQWNGVTFLFYKPLLVFCTFCLYFTSSLYAQ